MQKICPTMSTPKKKYFVSWCVQFAWRGKCQGHATELSVLSESELGGIVPSATISHMMGEAYGATLDTVALSWHELHSEIPSPHVGPYLASPKFITSSI